MQRAKPSRRFCAGALSMLAVLLAGCSTPMGGAEPPTAALAPNGQSRAGHAPGQESPLLLPLGGMGETAALAKKHEAGRRDGAVSRSTTPSVELITKDDGGEQPPGARAAADAAIKGRRRDHRRAAAVGIGGGGGSGGAPGRRPRARLLQQCPGRRRWRLPRELSCRTGGRRRIVSYAAARGKRRFAAPHSRTMPTAAVVEAAFRRSVERNGGTVAVAERYPAGRQRHARAGKAHRRGRSRPARSRCAPIDALFLPGGQDRLPQIGPVIAYAGLDTTKVKLLGTSAWDFPLDQPRGGLRRRLVPEPPTRSPGAPSRSVSPRPSARRRRASPRWPTTPSASSSACRPNPPRPALHGGQPDAHQRLQRRRRDRPASMPAA
ncbi:MAG: hypothetical protein WDN31_19795 [Hyphomicrobium sp.]